MRGSKVIIFVIEANKSSRSDENFIFKRISNKIYIHEWKN